MESPGPKPAKDSPPPISWGQAFFYGMAYASVFFFMAIFVKTPTECIAAYLAAGFALGAFQSVAGDIIRPNLIQGFLLTLVSLATISALVLACQAS